MSVLKTALVASFGLAIMASTAGAQESSAKTRLLAQSSCSSGMTYCSPGSYGPGGCYRMGYATCTAGLVCTGGTKACKPRNGGPAYCYKVGYGKCN